MKIEWRGKKLFCELAFGFFLVIINIVGEHVLQLYTCEHECLKRACL